MTILNENTALFIYHTPITIIRCKINELEMTIDKTIELSQLTETSGTIYSSLIETLSLANAVIVYSEYQKTFIKLMTFGQKEERVQKVQNKQSIISGIAKTSAIDGQPVQIITPIYEEVQV